MNILGRIQILSLLALVECVQAQVPKSFVIQRASDTTPASNTVNDLLADKNRLWAGTAGGLSLTDDFGISWSTLTTGDGMGRGSVSAIAVRDSTIWVAFAFDTTTELGVFDAGGGLSVSTDGGAVWRHVPQPVDSRDENRYKPTTTVIQNLTYDIALTDSSVWITSFGGGLRRTRDGGLTWEVVTVDGFPFDALGRLEHRVFSAHFDGTSLWVGSAAGIHKSSDDGLTWTTFNHTNQTLGISGNFIVAVSSQTFGDKKVVWAATVEALDPDEVRALSWTEDGGLTWTVGLEGEFVHNMAIDSFTGAVYAATDNGLFKTPDFGKSWALFPEIHDPENDEGVYTTEMTSAAVDGSGGLWVGTVDGLARTEDDGLTWTVFHAHLRPGTGKTPSTYAYPNPFSPMRHNVVSGDGHVRFRYWTESPTAVTVVVYDFGMNPVRTVVSGKDRPQPGDWAETWDGRNDVGEWVANGVYFYRISCGGDSPFWGKVVVVN